MDPYLNYSAPNYYLSLRDIRRNPGCVRCGGSLPQHSSSKIHPACFKEVQDLNDILLFDALPRTTLDADDLIRAHGLAIECRSCYRLTVVGDIWLKLPLELQMAIGSYDLYFGRNQVCSSCRFS